jgi:hypothetical protein
VSELTVLIIRHGEKPGEAWPGPGLNRRGQENPKGLVVRGWQRAGAWAALFGGGLGGEDYPRPDAVYAATPKGDDDNHSRRSLETGMVVAERLGLDAVTRFGVGEEAELVAEVLRARGVVLICWEHKKIGEAILPSLTGGRAGLRLPARWDPARYDLVLRLDRAESGAWRFRQLFPQLLSGDSAEAME